MRCLRRRVVSGFEFASGLLEGTMHCRHEPPVWRYADSVLGSLSNVRLCERVCLPIEVGEDRQTARVVCSCACLVDPCR
jgi:hypothetical protein